MIDDNEDGDPGDWLTETLKLTLTKGTVGATDADVSTVETPYVRPFTSTLRVAINDDEALRKPQLKFIPTDIQLAKENEKIVTVLMGVGAGGAGSLPGGIRTTLKALNTDNDRILLSVSPADAVGPSGTDRGIISISGFDVDDADVALEADGQGKYYIGTIGVADGDAGSGVVSDNAMTDGIKLKITAKEPSGFRDEMITLMVEDGRTGASKFGDGGGIENADSATVTVLSGEDTPTVTFSTESISIDEGESKSVHVLAGGMQGDEVGQR